MSARLGLADGRAGQKLSVSSFKTSRAHQPRDVRRYSHRQVSAMTTVLGDARARRGGPCTTPTARDAQTRLVFPRSRRGCGLTPRSKEAGRVARDLVK